MAKKRKRKIRFKGFMQEFLKVIVFGIIFYAVVCIIAACFVLS